MSHWATPYVGIPYQPGGRTRDGVDCYGLIALVYREVWGIAIPLFDHIDPMNPDDEAETVEVWSAIRESDWVVVPRGSEVPGDAVDLVVVGRPHCGLVTENGMMLHARPESGAAIQSYTRGGFCRRVNNIYRHSAIR